MANELGKDLKLSEYQKKIADFFVKHPTENMYINALAGSAKSTTALYLTKFTNTNDVYIAFNKSIQMEFKDKITNPRTKCYTIHSLGLQIMNANLKDLEEEKAVLDNLKIYKIIDEVINSFYRNNSDFMFKTFLRDNLYQLYNLVRLYYIRDYEENEDRIDWIKREYILFPQTNYTIEDDMIITLLNGIDEKSLEEFNDNYTCDFTDMLYITLNKLRAGEWGVPHYLQFTNILVDESQDLSAIQLFLLKYIKAKNGRYVFILDKNQAIYHFAGASSNSHEMIKKIYAPIVEFDLPINYRCGKEHLNLVNEKFHIPIKPSPTATDGKIIKIKKEEIINHIKEGDFIISRKNKWLVDCVVNLLNSGVPVYISDEDLPKNIVKFINKTKAKNLNDLEIKIKKNKDKRLAEITANNLDKNNNSTNATTVPVDGSQNGSITNTDTDSILDMLETVSILLIGFKEKNPNATVDGFIKYITKMLNTTNPKNCVRLMSVHKAKGLEAKNVFVLNEGKPCISPKASYDQNQQEYNLSYISFTRAKENLYLVKETES